MVKKTRKIRPKIKICFVCKICTTIGNHINCDRPQTCIICSSEDSEHAFNKCGNSPFCKNCGLAHPANSDNCDVLKRRVVAENDYLATLCVGEGILSRKVELLKWYKTNIYIEPPTGSALDLRVVKQMIVDHVQPLKHEISDVNDSLKQHDIKIKELASNVLEMKEALKSVSVKVDSCGGKVDELSEKIDTNNAKNLESVENMFIKYMTGQNASGKPANSSVPSNQKSNIPISKPGPG